MGYSVELSIHHCISPDLSLHICQMGTMLSLFGCLCVPPVCGWASVCDGSGRANVPVDTNGAAEDNRLC